MVALLKRDAGCEDAEVLPMTTQRRDDYIDPAEIEQRAQEHLDRHYRRRRTIGVTTMEPSDFWPFHQDFMMEPLLQRLAYLWWGDSATRKGRQMMHLMLAVSDLLQAASDHGVRSFDLQEDAELAEIIAAAVSPATATHRSAMRRFGAWQARAEQRKLDSIRSAAVFWITSEREAAARKAERERPREEPKELTPEEAELAHLAGRALGLIMRERDPRKIAVATLYLEAITDLPGGPLDYHELHQAVQRAGERLGATQSTGGTLRLAESDPMAGYMERAAASEQAARDRREAADK